MTADQIYDVIERIAATSSKTEKQALVKQYSVFPEFVRTLKAALDPFVTYGMAKPTTTMAAAMERTGTEGAVFDDSVWKMLDQMAARTLTGGAANDCVTYALQKLTPKSAKLLWRIITKDLRAGFSESTVNKAIPGCIRTFDCMLAENFKDYSAKVKYPMYAEPKLDGVRVLAFVNVPAQSVGFFSRSGKEFFGFDHLKEPLLELVKARQDHLRADGDEVLILAAEELNEIVLDAEVVAGGFNKTVGDVRRKDEQATDAILCVFDYLPALEFHRPGKDGVGKPYLNRRAEFEQIVPVSSGVVRLIPKYEVKSEAEIHALYEKMRSIGLEGLIVKDPRGLYHRRRNKGWLKIKAELEVDVPVVDLVEGTGKYERQLGALIVDLDGVRVNVGSGFSDDQRLAIWAEKGAYVGRLCAVQYHERTPDGSLRHPRWKTWRDDKPASDGPGC